MTAGLIVPVSEVAITGQIHRTRLRQGKAKTETHRLFALGRYVLGLPVGQLGNWVTIAGL